MKFYWLKKLRNLFMNLLKQRVNIYEIYTWLNKNDKLLLHYSLFYI